MAFVYEEQNVVESSISDRKKVVDIENIKKMPTRLE